MTLACEAAITEAWIYMLVGELGFHLPSLYGDHASESLVQKPSHRRKWSCTRPAFWTENCGSCPHRGCLEQIIASDRMNAHLGAHLTAAIALTLMLQSR